MIEFVVFSDPHVANYAACSTVQDGVNSRLQICLNALDQVREYAEKHRIPVTFCLGDLFQSTTRLDVEVLNATYLALKNWPGALICLVGNHDLAQPSRGIHALEVFKDQMIVIDQLTELELGGSRFFLAPYRREGWKEELKRAKADYYMLHQGIEGVAVRPGVYLKEPMSLDDLPSDGLVFSGHYHVFDRPLPNFIYPGSLLPQDWGDVGSKKGFLYVRGKKIKHLFTQAPEFVRLQLNEIGELGEYAGEIRGNYVRLEVIPGMKTDGLADAARELGALWVGVEGQAIEPGGDVTGEDTTASVIQLLKARVQKSQTSLKRRTLFTLGVRLWEEAKR